MSTPHYYTQASQQGPGFPQHHSSPAPVQQSPPPFPQQPYPVPSTQDQLPNPYISTHTQAQPPNPLNSTKDMSYYNQQQGYPAQPPMAHHHYSNGSQPNGYYKEQPGPTPGMSIGGNKNAKNLPFDSDGRREWTHGICGCCSDCGTCFYAWCCPCIVYSKNKRRIEYLNANNQPDPDNGGGCCTGSCWAHCCLTSFFGMGWVLQMGVRSSIRGRYRIKGGGCTDCLAACCCNPCELTQEAMEMELEEQSFGRRH